MTVEQIEAAQTSLESALTLVTTLFSGNITIFFLVALILGVWGILAFIVRKLLNYSRS